MPGSGAPANPPPTAAQALRAQASSPIPVDLAQVRAGQAPQGHEPSPGVVVEGVAALVGGWSDRYGARSARRPVGWQRPGDGSRRTYRPAAQVSATKASGPTRREPRAVVDQLGVADVQAGLLVEHVAVQGQVLEVPVGGDLASAPGTS